VTVCAVLVCWHIHSCQSVCYWRLVCCSYRLVCY